VEDKELNLKSFNLLQMDLRKLKLIPKDKKGLGIGDIYPVMLTICLVAILIGIVLFILQSFQTTMNNTVNGSLAANTTGIITTQISGFVPWIGIILLVVAAAIVIGVLVRSLGGEQNRT